jgi:hypothetical protein
MIGLPNTSALPATAARAATIGWLTSIGTSPRRCRCLPMTRMEEYWELADHYGKLAETANGSLARSQLQMLADNYMALAKSTQILDRSAKVLEALERHQKK